MRFGGLLLALIPLAAIGAQPPASLGERAQRYLVDLIRIDTTSPPGNETSAAEYLKRSVEENGIEAELLGPDPRRLNFVARLRGSGAQRPLILMAHTDVVPAEPRLWTVAPFSGELRDGFIYGRGAQDDKDLLAAELAVFIELKNSGVRLNRDIILLAESDEESGSTGIQWLIANAWQKIDAEAALNEGGVIQVLPSGVRLCQVQTTEKIPTRVVLTAHGGSGHASLPRPDNAVLRLARALTRLDTEQPVALNPTTREYFKTLASTPEYAWLAPLLPALESPRTAADACARIRARDLELDAQLHTTVTPTMLSAGYKINVIPNTAEAQVDIRRLPTETRGEVLDRLRRLVPDSAVDIVPAGAQEMPATEPSPAAHPVFKAMEAVLRDSSDKALVVPFMSRGATDGSYLRQKGMAVYGVPLFPRERGESRAHGNDERIEPEHLRSGAGLLWEMVLRIGQEP